MKSIRDDTTIPDCLKLAAAEIAKVCRTHGLYTCAAKLTLPHPHDMGEVDVFWRQGHSGEEMDVMTLTYHKRISVKVDVEIDHV